MVYGCNWLMARPIRVEVAGGMYHVIVRGNERRAVFAMMLIGRNISSG